MKKRKNIYFIAKETGVSVATISRFFNNKNLVKRSTREKVLSVCNKYKYRPSRIASAITTKRTKSIALLVPSTKDPVLSDLINGVETKLASKGYCMIFFNTKQSIDKELEILDIISNRIIDGMIVSGVYGSKEDKLFISKVQEREIPCILVDRYIVDTGIPYVASNDYYGGQLAAEYILENNHKNIGIVTYDTKIYIFNERIRGFVDFLKKKGIREKYIIETPRQIGKIGETIIKNREMFLSGEVSVIFANTDLIAIHLMQLLLENNINVPGKISIMGYDNMFFSRFTTPKLSTINHDMFELGSIAADNLINKLKKNRHRIWTQTNLPK